MKLDYNALLSLNLKTPMKSKLNDGVNLLCDLAGQVGFGGVVVQTRDGYEDSWSVYMHDMPEYEDQAHGLELDWRVWTNGETAYIRLEDMKDRKVDCYVSTGDVKVHYSKRNMSFWTKLGGHRYDCSAFSRDRTISFGHPEDFERWVDKIAKYINKSNTLNKCKLANMEALANFKRAIKKAEIESSNGEYIAGAIEEQLKELLAGTGLETRIIVEDTTRDVPQKWSVSITNWRNAERYELWRNCDTFAQFLQRDQKDLYKERAKMYLSRPSLNTDYDKKLKDVIDLKAEEKNFEYDLTDWFNAGTKRAIPKWYSLDKRFNKNLQEYTEETEMYFTVQYWPTVQSRDKFSIKYSLMGNFHPVVQKAIRGGRKESNFFITASDLDEAKALVRRVIAAEEKLWKLYDHTRNEEWHIAMDIEDIQAGK